MTVPIGVNPALLGLSAGLNARGAETVAMMTELTTTGSLFSDIVGVNCIGYAAVDGINEATLAI